MNKFDEIFNKIIREERNRIRSNKNIIKEDEDDFYSYFISFNLTSPIILAKKNNWDFAKFEEQIKEFVYILDGWNLRIKNNENDTFNVNILLKKGELAEFFSEPIITAVDDKDTGSIIYDCTNGQKTAKDCKDDESTIEALKVNSEIKVENGKKVTEYISNAKLMFYSNEFLLKAFKELNGGSDADFEGYWAEKRAWHHFN